MSTKESKTERLFTKIREGLELTTREEIELVVRLSIPAIFAQISFVAMQIIDASMVGHLGEIPAAAVALVSTSIWLIWGLVVAVTTPFSVQTAHRIGAKNFDEARDLLRQSFTAGFLFSAVFALIGALISPYLPGWIGGNPDLHQDASAYFLVFALGLPCLIFNFIATSMLRSTGEIKIPSLTNIFMCFLDVLFNWILIYPTDRYEVFGFSFTMWGAGFGVTGAALGTVLAEAVCALIMMYFLLVKNNKLALVGHPGSFKLRKAVMRRCFQIGLPMALERCAMTTAQILTTVIVAPLGNVALAAHSFSITAESLCYMPGFGISDAASTLVGQSYGAKRRELAKKFAWINVCLAMCLMALMGGIMYAFAPEMIRVMTPLENIVSLGSECLRIQAFAEPFFASAIVCYSIFVALGRTLGPSLINFGSMWGIRLPLAYVLSLKFGLTGVWIAMALELTARGSVFLYRLYRLDLNKLKETVV